MSLDVLQTPKVFVLPLQRDPSLGILGCAGSIQLKLGEYPFCIGIQHGVRDPGVLQLVLKAGYGHGLRTYVVDSSQ